MKKYLIIIAVLSLAAPCFAQFAVQTMYLKASDSSWTTAPRLNDTIKITPAAFNSQSLNVGRGIQTWEYRCIASATNNDSDTCRVYLMGSISQSTGKTAAARWFKLDSLTKAGRADTGTTYWSINLTSYTKWFSNYKLQFNRIRGRNKFIGWCGGWQ